jgi:hypothetical protein
MLRGEIWLPIALPIALFTTHVSRIPSASDSSSGEG